jgi:hypothetical protein
MILLRFCGTLAVPEEHQLAAVLQIQLQYRQCPQEWLA